MNINTYAPVSGMDLSQKDLLTYLAQIVLSKTDTRTELATDELNRSKIALSNAKDNLKSVKGRLQSLLNEYEKFRLMYEVLKKIDTLKREGIVVGANKTKILKILNSIESQSIQTLKSLEDKLSAYVPESPKFSYN
jgi:archaellum component FlaC